MTIQEGETTFGNRMVAWERIWLNVVVASPLFGPRARKRLLRWSGIRSGSDEVRMYSGVYWGGSRAVSFGEDVFINAGVVFDACAPISFGSHIAVGHQARFLTATHVIGPPDGRAGPMQMAPIRIEDGAWIGAGATVLAGVTVGPGCVIAAGSVVTADCERDGLYAGSPARRVRDLPAFADRHG